jgi:ArsR family transcriptional regulator, arsenate/arsenite/antimonite-responsive transcriptional repressor
MCLNFFSLIKSFALAASQWPTPDDALDSEHRFHNIGIMETKLALTALSALGHESRLAAYRQLVQADTDGLTVGELRDRLALPPATLSAHLNVLRAAGLVQDEREGRVIRVRADYGQMNALLAYLTENCCAGAPCTAASSCKPSTKRSRK